MGRTVHKAVIPVAGLGTRLRPISAVVPKAMLPLVDAAPQPGTSRRGDRRRPSTSSERPELVEGRAGRVLPVLHHILAEAASAGAEQVALVVSPPQEPMLRRYLDAAREADLGDLPGEVRWLLQDRPAGFGHAVWLARDFVGGEPFLLLLGDHVHVADRGRPTCAAQVVAAFGQHGGAAMVGMQPVGRDELPRVGVARGEPLGGEVYRCTDFVEKPDPAAARARLVTAGLAKGRFLAHAGIYVFSPEIFGCLEELLSGQPPAGGEVQLADAQSILLRRRPRQYHLVRIRGRAYDTGTPAGYAAALAALAGLRPGEAGRGPSKGRRP